MSSGFVIADRKLPWGDLRKVLVRDQIKIEHWLRNEGGQFTEARTWDDLIELAVEIDSQPDAEAQQAHPEFKFSLAVAVWVAMRQAGDNVDPGDTFGLFTWDELSFYSDESQGKAPAVE